MWITFSISMYIMCVCLFSALSRRVGALQISIIIIITATGQPCTYSHWTAMHLQPLDSHALTITGQPCTYSHWTAMHLQPLDSHALTATGQPVSPCQHHWGQPGKERNKLDKSWDTGED